MDRGVKRRAQDRDAGHSAAGGRNPLHYLHYRLLVPVNKAGAVIGKGGEFINKMKDMSAGAKISMDKPFRDYDERVIHIESDDIPGRPRAPAQDGLMLVLDRVLGDEQPDGSVRPPAATATARLLVYKFEIGSVLGLRGATINDIRSKTGASIKIEDNAGEAGMPLALPDDQLVKVSGSYKQVTGAIERISERIRVVPPSDLVAAQERKRMRMGLAGGPGGPPGAGGGPPPYGGGGGGGGGPPPGGYGGPPGAGGGGPPYGQFGGPPGGGGLPAGAGDPYGCPGGPPSDGGRYGGPPPPGGAEMAPGGNPYGPPPMHNGGGYGPGPGGQPNGAPGMGGGQYPPQQQYPPPQQQQQQQQYPPPQQQQQQYPPQQQQQYPPPSGYDDRGLPPMGGGPPDRGPPPAAPDAGGDWGGGMMSVLPPPARAAFADNSSVDVRGLVGFVTTEFRLLVPTYKGGIFIGERGSVARRLRDRFGVKLLLQEAVSGAKERILQIMSTEEVRDPRCDALDAALHCADMLLHDREDDRRERPLPRGVGRVRMLLTKSQCGAVMGRKGTTIKAIRAIARTDVDLIARPGDRSGDPPPAGCRDGDEVLQVTGDFRNVVDAIRIACVAVRGNLSRGQLVFKHAPPADAPKPSRRGPPAGGQPAPSAYDIFGTGGGGGGPPSGQDPRFYPGAEGGPGPGPGGAPNDPRRGGHGAGPPGGGAYGGPGPQQQQPPLAGAFRDPQQGGGGGGGQLRMQPGGGFGGGPGGPGYGGPPPEQQGGFGGGGGPVPLGGGGPPPVQGGRMMGGPMQAPPQQQVVYTTNYPPQQQQQQQQQGPPSAVVAPQAAMAHAQQLAQSFAAAYEQQQAQQQQPQIVVVQQAPPQQQQPQEQPTPGDGYGGGFGGQAAAFGAQVQQQQQQQQQSAQAQAQLAGVLAGLAGVVPGAVGAPAAAPALAVAAAAAPAEPVIATRLVLAPSQAAALGPDKLDQIRMLTQSGVVFAGLNEKGEHCLDMTGTKKQVEAAIGMISMLVNLATA